MKDTDYHNLIEVTNVTNGFVPYNEKAVELNEQTKTEKILVFKEITSRDINRHKGYMALLNYIYDFLPPTFKNDVPKKNFYKWLKHLRGDFEVLYDFVDLPPMLEYISISFANMSEAQFIDYIKNQLPLIYKVIRRLYKKDKSDTIIENIEDEFMRFLIKL